MIFIFYIKEIISYDEMFDDTSTLPVSFKKLTVSLFKKTNTIIIKENIILLPYQANELKKLSDKKLHKIFKKIHKLLTDENVKTIALSNALHNMNNIDVLNNQFYSKNYDILNGRWLFKHLSFEILEYISKERKTPINEMEVSILSNSYNDFIKDNIQLLSQNVKNLNIVTSNADFFRPLVQEMFEAYGLSIRISNNKRKILTNSDVVFNFDFPDVILNKFALPLNGTIINYNGKIKLRNKLFNGLNISYYAIDIHKQLIENFRSVNLLNSFNLEILYESLYYNETSYNKMLTHFIDDSLIITSLHGNNGKISKTEYKVL